MGATTTDTAAAAATVRPPLLPDVIYSLAELRTVTGLGESTIDRAAVTGALRSVKVGRRRLVRGADALAWLGLD